MRTLYESILDGQDEIVAKSEKYMEQQKMIKDIGLYEIFPLIPISKNSKWLQKLNIKTNYTSLFEPYVKRHKNWFEKNSKDISGFVGIIFNMLLNIKKSHREIYVWDYYSTGPRPDGLEYMEQMFKKHYHLDLQINCANMAESNTLLTRLEFYDNETGSFFYLYFEEDKFDKYIN